MIAQIEITRYVFLIILILVILFLIMEDVFLVWNVTSASPIIIFQAQKFKILI